MPKILNIRGRANRQVPSKRKDDKAEGESRRNGDEKKDGGGNAEGGRRDGGGNLDGGRRDGGGNAEVLGKLARFAEENKMPAEKEKRMPEEREQEMAGERETGMTGDGLAFGLRKRGLRRQRSRGWTRERRGDG